MLVSLALPVSVVLLVLLASLVALLVGTLARRRLRASLVPVRVTDPPHPGVRS
jgi:hypothetical protein